ncbi:MAG: hypothetical protein SGARI_007059 [Bacillariaceae sp.]
MALTKRKTSQNNGTNSLSGMPGSPSKKGSNGASLPMICAVAALLGAVVYASNSFLAPPAADGTSTSTVLRQSSVKNGNCWS